jgi:hypothetical protein
MDTKQRTYRLNELNPAIVAAIKKQYPTVKKVKSIWSTTKQGRSQQLIAIT